MSYDGEKMDSLRIELRKFRGLKEEIEKLNDNMQILNRLVEAIEKQNELKEQELGIQYKKTNKKD